MKLKSFNYPDFKQYGENKIGLTAPVNTQEANACKQYFRNSKGEKESGDAVSALDFFPTENNIVIASVWHLAPLTITNEDQLRKEPPIINFLVAKGANVLNIQLGEVLELSQNINITKVDIMDNSRNMLDLIKHYQNPLTKLEGSQTTRPVFVVEYFVLPAHGVLGIYGSLETLYGQKG